MTTGIGKRTELKSHSPLLRRALPGLVIAVLFLIPSLFLTSCGEAKNRRELAERMAEEEGLPGDDARIKELQASIRAVDSDVEKTIASLRKKADFWRLLGMKYMDYSMWGEGMHAFGEALKITPDHASLQYNRGLCAGQLSLSAISQGERMELLSIAEASYRRAIALDSRYTAPKYGLGILLVFELNRPGEAIPVLEDFLSIERSHIPGHFLLARAYLETGRVNDALNMYEEISISKTASQADKNQADDLHDRILEGNYGS